MPRTLDPRRVTLFGDWRQTATGATVRVWRQGQRLSCNTSGVTVGRRRQTATAITTQLLSRRERPFCDEGSSRLFTFARQSPFGDWRYSGGNRRTRYENAA